MGLASTRLGMRAALLLVSCALFLCALAPSAGAQSVPPAPVETLGSSPDQRPPGFRLTAGDAVDVAETVKEVRDERAKRGRLVGRVARPDYIANPTLWLVTYKRDGVDVVEVHVDGRTGRVLEVWTGPYVG